MSITLRPHQNEATAAVIDYWRGGGGNALVSVCVGGGKSYIQADLAKRMIDTYPVVNVLGLTLNKELIAQNASSTERFWKGAPVGINCAGLGKRDTSSKIVFAHPMSVVNCVQALGPRHIVMVDEVHNVSRSEEDGVYAKIFNDLRRSVPDLRLVGLTGTPYRLDSGRLDEPWRGKMSIWGKVVYEYGLMDGIKDGFLVPVLARKPGLTLDVSNVKTRGGEFIDSQLQKAVDRDDINDAIATDILIQTRDRNSCIVFATGIDHAQHLATLLQQKGATAVVVHGKMPDKERDKAISWFKSGAAKYLVNVGIATTGFDYPPCDAMACVRPTKSPGLLTQMTGRIMRASPGKNEALALDYAGNFQRLGCIDQIDGRKSGGMGGGPPPTKECPSCEAILPAGKRRCSCGHEFPELPPELSPTAIDAPVLSSQVKSDWRNVDDVNYTINQRRDHEGKPLGPPSLRITYICGTAAISEFLAFESEKPAGRAIAAQKWRSRSTWDVSPSTAMEALSMKNTLRKPGRIQVRKATKYYDVLAVDMSVPPACDMPPPQGSIQGAAI